MNLSAHGWITTWLTRSLEITSCPPIYLHCGCAATTQRSVNILPTESFNISTKRKLTTTRVAFQRRSFTAVSNHLFMTAIRWRLEMEIFDFFSVENFLSGFVISEWRNKLFYRRFQSHFFIGFHFSRRAMGLAKCLGTVSAHAYRRTRQPRRWSNEENRTRLGAAMGARQLPRL